MIEENVKKILAQLSAPNPFGEKVTLVAAVKTQTVEAINCAISAGVCDIGDNHAQEFRDNYPKICGNVRRHFIGHLQENKIKYLIGKTDLYHSIDSISLAQKLDNAGAKLGVVSHILLQINIGNEDTKSGFLYEELENCYGEIAKLKNIRVDGLMAMLPNSDDQPYLKALATKMRAGYDGLNAKGANLCHLSMGMSGDWRLCIECGSNMVRLGTAIFGARSYN